jgi:acyl carrier protein|tara:strand:+ start:554 stop:793 length:240 start_codon:yes stop_codon:yes gene_type:complete
MSNLEKYKQAFVDSLSIDQKLLNKDLKYNDVPEWDSIGHMTLMSDLEEKFKINIDTDDIVDFSSFKKGMEILQKYKVEF